MALFAELDNNNYVSRVIVVNNNELIDDLGNESEQKGIDFCKSLYGEDTNWVQTSYNKSIRKTFAGIGMYYDSIKDAFIGEKPYPSWTLDEETCDWKPPIARPGSSFYWVEETQKWLPNEV